MIDLKKREKHLSDEYDKLETKRSETIQKVKEMDKVLLMLKGAFEEINHWKKMIKDEALRKK